MIQGIRKYLNAKAFSSRGYTFTEALVTIVLVAIVSAAMATGVAYAARQYTEMMSASEAKVLDSTLKNVIQNELAITENVTLGSQNADGSYVLQSFYSPNYTMEGSGVEGVSQESQFIVVNGGRYGEIALCSVSDSSKYKKLVSSATYSQGLGASVEVVYYKEVTNASNKKDNIPAHFSVTLTIADSAGKVVIKDVFDVEHLNPENAA